MSEERQSTTPPYVAYGTFKNFLGSISEPIPQVVDKSLMQKIAGGARNQLQATLRFLGLVDENDHPTKLMHDYCDSDEAAKRELFKRMIEVAYPFMKAGFAISNATTSQLETEFRNLGISGDTLRKSTQFFVALARDAGLEVSKYITPSRSGTGGQPSQRLKRKSGSTANTKSKKSEGDPITPPPSENKQSITELLLQKFPEFDPSWSDEIKKQWFESYSEFMSRTKT